MRRLNFHTPRIAGLLALALGAVALLALSAGAAAKDRRGDEHGHHGRHHHHHHREFPMREAGTISSFDPTTGKLTIALTGGESVSGLVTADTRIKCEGVDDRLRRRDDGGDDNGGRGDEPGDDNGGDLEPGDDNSAEATCTTASLTAGTVVGEAELRLEGGAAVFEEVELGFHS